MNTATIETPCNWDAVAVARTRVAFAWESHRHAVKLNSCWPTAATREAMDVTEKAFNEARAARDEAEREAGTWA